ncbi:hypothetical protein OVA24_15585 [Luteolibacter sp. SL250]|uniref:hypothetical protein n=1 Tax=Luteolibacter sp. SL250 TaxID=2995170 RepID=UPI00226DA143|nr:hypothetical protein [Luteolibacter sp. SL250]WAC18654.1 hypothetical protein OVA24_15585 [Luteolibacter sp. SL250]
MMTHDGLRMMMLDQVMEDPRPAGCIQPITGGQVSKFSCFARHGNFQMKILADF